MDLEFLINALINELHKQGELSPKILKDRHYTNLQFYELRAALLTLVFNYFPDLAWKTKRHFDGTMYKGDFLVGINTPSGVGSYHLPEIYFNNFHIPEIECGPEYDGYYPDDVVLRLKSIPFASDDYTESGGEETIYKPLEITVSQNAEKIGAAMNLVLDLLRNDDKISFNNISDGHHTRELLYRQRRILIGMLCQIYRDLAWMSEFDKDGKPIPDYKFLVGLETPQGWAVSVFNKTRIKEFGVPIIDRAPIEIDDVFSNDPNELVEIHNGFLRKVYSLPGRTHKI
ncbi:MAG TPA: hypothetical protein PLX66_02235 [Bacilli bacterium]|nr:hypothetical protein [Bacilli bacterium]